MQKETYLTKVFSRYTLIAIFFSMFLLSTQAAAFASDEVIESVAYGWSLDALSNQGNVWSIKMQRDSMAEPSVTPEFVANGVKKLNRLQRNGLALINDKGQLFGVGNWSTLLPEGSPAPCDYKALERLQYFMNEALDAATNIDFNLTLKKDGTLWAWNCSDSGPVMLSQEPLLRDVATFDTADGMGTVVVTQDGKLWFWDKDLPITTKPKLLMQGIQDAALSTDSSLTMVALGKDGQLYMFGSKFKNNARAIAKNVTRVKGKGLGPVCFTTSNNNLWTILTYYPEGGDSAGIPPNYPPEITSAHKDILLKQKVYYRPHNVTYVGLLAKNVTDFWPSSTGVVIKTADGKIYGHGSFDGQVQIPKHTTAPRPEPEYFGAIDIKLDSTSQKPRYDLDEIARNATRQKTAN